MFKQSICSHEGFNFENARRRAFLDKAREKALNIGFDASIMCMKLATRTMVFRSSVVQKSKILANG